MTLPQILQILFSYALQTAIVVGAAWYLEARTADSQIKVRIWTTCFLCLLGLLVSALLLPRTQWGHPWEQVPPLSRLRAAELAMLVSKTAIGFWVVGVLLFLGKAGGDFARVRRFLNSCPLASDTSRQRILSLCTPSLLAQIGKDFEFRVSPEELGPFCYQLHRPLVLLPRTMIAGDAAELRHVLDHELAHLGARHPLQLFLQRIVSVVLWFHPLVWMGNKRAGLVREFACDDVAARATAHPIASRAAYLRTLLRIVEQRANAHSGMLSIRRSPSELRVRAERLATRPVAESRSSSWSIAWVLMVGLLVSQIWLPIDPLTSARSWRSPWPTWSAELLFACAISVHDFQDFDPQTNLHELREAAERIAGQNP